MLAKPEKKALKKGLYPDKRTGRNDYWWFQFPVNYKAYVIGSKRDDSYSILHAAFSDKCVNEREMNCFSLANLYHFGGEKMNEIEIILSLLTENKTWMFLMCF